MYVGYVCINFSWALSIRQAPSGASIHTRFALHVMGLLNPGVYVCHPRHLFQRWLFSPSCS